VPLLPSVVKRDDLGLVLKVDQLRMDKTRGDAWESMREGWSPEVILMRSRAIHLESIASLRGRDAVRLLVLDSHHSRGEEIVDPSTLFVEGGL